MSAAEKISITLTPAMNRMIQRRVKSGQFASSSELIREALRAWQKQEDEHQERIASIRARIKASINNPRPSLSTEEAFAELKSHHESRKTK